jgi:hypothetical protein
MRQSPPSVAFYLPQFHPIPENDAWWGKGFTEWTNVAHAKPLFRGHHQPRLPADLGFYDLRVPEVREAQAQLAREHGIDGFCYWHYWFGNGRQLLERPFREVLASGKPDFPFCLAWANESWTGHWKGQDRTLLMPQEYPGDEDYVKHFQGLLPAFRDPRYLRVRGRLLFYVYRPRNLPDPARFISIWRDLARSEGIEDFFFVAGGWYDSFQGRDEIRLSAWGFDASNAIYPRAFGAYPRLTRLKRSCLRCLGFFANRLDFLEAVENMHDGVGSDVPNCPTILTGWDTTARHGRDGWVMTGFNAASFRRHVERVLTIAERPEAGPVVFIKSWNEWAEGNYVEPDMKHGTAFLEVIRDCRRTFALRC